MPSREEKRLLQVTALILLMPLLNGCLINRDNSDLTQYLSEINSRSGGRIPPVPDFKPYEPFPYTGTGERNPFKLEEGDNFLSTLTTQEDDGGLKPDISRRREALEKFPLDSLRHVGVLEQNGEQWGIVVDSDGIVHRVGVGNYLGQNHGRITSITETRIELLELYRNERGKWFEQTGAISLIE
ncbi:MAG: pilus assembly protein PilP [Gammaproteobacteria bacterium]|nr:pilus assembly protein PilP [Gammaproteobacteria bacterium]